MPRHVKEWFYLDEAIGRISAVLSLEELDALRQLKKIEDITPIYNIKQNKYPKQLRQSVPFSALSRSVIIFSPSVRDFYEIRNNRPLTIFSGPNNSGKTFLLKQMLSLIGPEGYLIACNRFSHVDMLNTRQPVTDYETRLYYDNLLHSLHTSQQNSENNDLQLEQVITTLKDSQREKLFQVCKELLGNEFTIKRSEPDNSFSSCYVDMDGENLRYGSSGTRLLLTLLGIILDERFSVILIDEPELGLNPRIQAILASFLYDHKKRQLFCPHLRQLFIATHSHLFLDNLTFSNNYMVTKVKNTIYTKQVQSYGDLHQLQFNMLGNEMESLFLPSAIVIAEGDSDVTFLTKVTRLHIPSRNIAIVRAGGAGETHSKLNVFRDAFGDLTRSPYHHRIFVVLDKKHSTSFARLEREGVLKENIFEWSENGIEHLYPPELLAAAFCCDVSELIKIKLESDPIEYNSIRKSKKALAQIIADNMTTAYPLHRELQELIMQIQRSCE